MSDMPNFDHIPTRTLWKIVADVTVGDASNHMTDRITYYVVLDGIADYPEPERVIHRATGGHARQIRLVSLARLGAGVSIDFDDGFVVVAPRGES